MLRPALRPKAWHWWIVCAAVAACSQPKQAGAPVAHDVAGSAVPMPQPAAPMSDAAPERSVDDPDAVVLAVQGAVQVRGEGVELVARADLPLVRRDALAVGSKSLLLLVLRNGYAVRLDEDLELKVEDIALLDAPPADVSLEEQLRDLVDDGEIEAPADRIVGWQQRLRAGRGLAARTGDAGVVEEVKEGEADEASALRLVPSPSPRPPRPLAKPMTPAPPMAEESRPDDDAVGGGGNGAARGAASRDEAADPINAPGMAKKKEKKGKAASPHRYRAEPEGAWVVGLPPLIDAKVPALRACLAERVPRLSAPGQRVGILLRFSGGEVDRVAIVGAPSVPCAVELFRGASDPTVVGDGWLRVDLVSE